MTPRAVDMLEEGFPHGTTDGFARGCRSAGACPAGHEHGLSCRRAQILAAGNYQYQQLVRAGEEPAIIAQMLRLTPEAKTDTKPAAPAPRTPEPEIAAPVKKAKWAVRHAWVAFDPDGRMHGPFDGQPSAIAFVGEHLRPAQPEPPRATRRRWTDADTEQLKTLLSQDLTDNQIAKRMGRSQGFVSMRRRSLGLPSLRDRTQGART